MAATPYLFAGIIAESDLTEMRAVCADCFSDYALKAFISRTATQLQCSYCGKLSNAPIASDFEGVLEHMLTSILTEWDDASNGLGWSNEMGGFIMGPVYGTHDLLDELKLDFSTPELQRDVARALGDISWCSNLFYRPKPHERLLFSWERFCENVKHKTRYVFFRRRVSADDAGTFDAETIGSSQLLDHINAVVNSLDLVEILGPDTDLFRVRCHENDFYSQASELGTPPVEFTKENRMNPIGIPMFYAAFDEETSLVETEQDGKPYASIATFNLSGSVNVLNLCDLPEVPSLFDADKRSKREGLKFLKSFSEMISSPTDKSDSNHTTDYIPTQVMTEYFRFRHEFGDNGYAPIHGIVYPSAKSKGGRSIVLFFNQDDCVEENPHDVSTTKLIIKHVKHKRI